MTSFDASLIEIHPETPAEWRAWLGEHHATSHGVWSKVNKASIEELIAKRAETRAKRLASAIAELEAEAGDDG